MLLLVQSGSVPPLIAYPDNLFLQVIRIPNALFNSAEHSFLIFFISWLREICAELTYCQLAECLPVIVNILFKSRNNLSVCSKNGHFTLKTGCFIPNTLFKQYYLIPLSTLTGLC